MIAILVLWHIKKGQEKAFVTAWKENFYVNNRDKLIGEFLCKPMDNVEDLYKTWTVASMGSPTEPVSAYVNIGMWESFEAFRAEISQYIPEPGAPPPPFQVARYRVVLEPVAWRVGRTDMTKHDSGRTF